MITILIIVINKLWSTTRIQLNHIDCLYIVKITNTIQFKRGGEIILI